MRTDLSTSVNGKKGFRAMTDKYPTAKRIREWLDGSKRNSEPVSEQENEKAAQTEPLTRQEQEDKQGNIEQSFLLRQAKTEIISLKEELSEQSRKAAAKIEHQNELLRVVTEEKENLMKELEALEIENRFQVIEALHSGCFDTEEDRNHSINSFAKSTMPIEYIKSHCDQLREIKTKNVQVRGTKESKLQQRSIGIE